MPKSDIAILDGKAAIAMRSWQSGKSRIRATSPGLKDGTLEITTLDGPPFIPGVTPIVADRPYAANDADLPIAKEEKFGTNSPTGASSSAPGHPSRLASDGDPATFWAPEPTDAHPRVMVDPERILLVRRIRIVFPEAAGYGFVAELQKNDGTWEQLAKEDTGTDTRQVREVATQSLTGERMRVWLTTPKGAQPGISEIVMTGILQTQ